MEFNRVIKLFLLVSLLVMAMTSVSFAAKQDFALKNNTGYTIKEVYIGESGSKSWGSDFLKGGGISAMFHGETIDMFFDKTSTRYWDIRAVFSDGSYWDYLQNDLVKIDTIILERDGSATRYYDKK